MTWTTLSGRTIGSVHVRDELPLQDAVLTWSDDEHAIVAVADGHGHRLHFRSDVGADLAVRCAVEVLREQVLGAGLLSDAAVARAEAPAVGAAVVEEWRARVEQHAAEHPFLPGDPGDPGPGSLQPYGSTLLAVAAGPGVMAFWQVGDGDSVVVHRTGEVARPLPEDPDLDGLRTSSLCQPDPVASLRTTAVDLDEHEVVLAYLCTDGFGKPRVDADWWSETGSDLLRFGRERGLPWIAEQLPDWLAEPARVGGDDVTMGIVARPDLSATPRPPAPPTVPAPEG